MRMYPGMMDGHAAHVSIEVHRSPGRPDVRASESIIGDACAADADGGLLILWNSNHARAMIWHPLRPNGMGPIRRVAS